MGKVIKLGTPYKIILIGEFSTVGNRKMDDMGMRFSVIDLLTGKEPDLEQIALNEEWAKDLMYCDMEGFHIDEDGTLCLADECGKYAYCPHDRFKIEVEFSKSKEAYVFVY